MWRDRSGGGRISVDIWDIFLRGSVAEGAKLAPGQKGCRIWSPGIHSFLAFALLKKAPRELRGIDRILSEQTVAVTDAFRKTDIGISPNGICE